MVGKSLVIPNAVKPQPSTIIKLKRWLVQSLGLVHKLPLVMTLGRINPTKNYEALLIRLRSTPGQSAYDGPPEDAVLERIGARAGTINESILLIPGLYGPEKQSLLSAADVFVTTTHVDSFNLTVAEALFRDPGGYPSWIGIAEFLDSPISISVDSVNPAS